jgi:hypothetical protein
MRESQGRRAASGIPDCRRDFAAQILGDRLFAQGRGVSRCEVRALVTLQFLFGCEPELLIAAVRRTRLLPELVRGEGNLFEGRRREIGLMGFHWAKR